MIIVTSKITVRRGTDSQLPGTPINAFSNPPTFNTGLDTGEFGYSIDSERLFIGASPSIGNINYQRTTFPYQNVEVLTEASPAVKQLFDLNIRDQDRNSYFVPTLLTPNATWNTVTYSAYEGGMALPTRFSGQSVSASVEYHAFINNQPVKQGTVHILASNTSVSVSDANTSVYIGNSPVVEFNVTSQQLDGDGYYYLLQAKNHDVSNSVTLLIRRSVIVGFSA